MSNQFPQRLAFVTETYPPEVNGVALTVRSMLLELKSLRHSLTLVRPERPDAEPEAGVTDVRVAGVSLPRYPGLRFGLPAFAKLKRLFKSQQIEAVYVATEGPLGMSAVSAARALSIPVCTGFHTRFDDYMQHYSFRLGPWRVGHSLLKRLALSWLRRVHNRASFTVVPTHELKDFLAQAGIHRVALLPRSVDLNAFNPRHRTARVRARFGLTDDQLMLLHVGRIAREKNIELLLRTVDAIERSHPGTRMVWVGDGPLRAELESRHPKHFFVGVQRGIELSELYASADLFLFPSLSETFGNVSLEALASGIDLCAFNYGAARAYAKNGEHAWLAPPHDADAFVARALAAADAKRGGRGLGDKAREAVADVQRHMVAQKLLELFAEGKEGLRSGHDTLVHSTIL
jgi:glycosyltransferase involved in cell wall biosynthesis